MLTLSRFGNAQQNLVYNGDFEIYDTCPDNLGQVNRCTGWWQPTEATSDYFNACSTAFGIAVPYTVAIYQEAKSGNGYCGFHGYFKSFPFEDDPYLWIEYIESALTHTLEKDKMYLISFSLNLSNDSKVANKNVGVHLSDEPLSATNSLPLTVTPQVACSDFITDTLNWVDVSGYYVAKGNEKYITIGAFYPSGIVDTLMLSNDAPTPDLNTSYYIVDDVSIIESDVIIPNVFTPNEDGVNDFIDFSFLPQNMTIVIVNRWGNVIFESSKIDFKWDGTNLNNEPCNEGIYFYLIRFSDNCGNESMQNGTISLIK